jgi:hypothetical protein
VVLGVDQELQPSICATSKKRSGAEMRRMKSRSVVHKKSPPEFFPIEHAPFAQSGPSIQTLVIIYKAKIMTKFKQLIRVFVQRRSNWRKNHQYNVT